MFFAAFVLLAVAACAVYFGPFGPTGRPDPDDHPDRAEARLLLSVALRVCSRCLPPSLETPALLIGPVVVIGFLVLLPFLSGEGEKSWRRRPIAVLTVLLIAVTLGTFTHLAGYTPWSPHMNAWSGDPVPDRFLHGTPRWNDKARSSFKSSSAATAILLVKGVGKGDQRSTLWPFG